MEPVFVAMVYALIAGAAIPLGGFIASIERIHSARIEVEFQHSIVAFGAGALLSAVALVLVPEGMESLTITKAMAAFAVGAVVFCAISAALKRSGNSKAQLMAMLMDFIPESFALGALLSTDRTLGLLLALLIGLQNLPEGFNAFRELRIGRVASKHRLLLVFCALALLGPVSAFVGFAYLQDMPQTLGMIMLFSAGGILFLMFQDIAPAVPLKQTWIPPFFGVAGFAVGMLGQALIG